MEKKPYKDLERRSGPRMNYEGVKPAMVPLVGPATPMKPVHDGTPEGMRDLEDSGVMMGDAYDHFPPLEGEGMIDVTSARISNIGAAEKRGEQTAFLGPGTEVEDRPSLPD